MDMNWHSFKQDCWAVFIKEWNYRIGRLREKVISENVLYYLAVVHDNQTQRNGYDMDLSGLG